MLRLQLKLGLPRRSSWWRLLAVRGAASAAPGSGVAAFVGPYAECRAALDYQYHAVWPPDRQAIQDSIIAECLRQGSSSASPWLVFSAGPMGAGKTHTFRSLAARSLFPLHKFVHIDPDRIRTRLPEMPALISQNRALAGVLTHKEATYIAEVVENEALRRGRNVLVDGTLKDAEWYRQRFAFIRSNFPQYRIAVVLVMASRAKVFERAARRALVTGREVPAAVLDDALARAPASFRALAPLSDYAVEIDNDNDERGPAFTAPCTAASFASIWGLTGGTSGAPAADGGSGAASAGGGGPGKLGVFSSPEASAPPHNPHGSGLSGREGRETVAEYRRRVWASDEGGYGGGSIGVLGLLSSANRSLFRSVGSSGNSGASPVSPPPYSATSAAAAAASAPASAAVPGSPTCISGDHDAIGHTNGNEGDDDDGTSWDMQAAAADVDDPLAEPLGRAGATPPPLAAAARARDEELAAAYDGPATSKQR